MRTQDAVQHFGSQQAVADALGIKQPSVAGWGKYPPALRQLQLEALTGTKLLAEPWCHKRRRPKGATQNNAASRSRAA